MHFGPFHTHANQTVDLGDEAPLVVQDGRNALPDRRKVSVRWLTGTVLTGITSVVLMGGALLAALDGQYSVTAATLPEQTDLSIGMDGTVITGTKGDRIARAAADYANKQIIPVNVVTKSGDKELIKVRPYSLVTSSLATRKSADFSQDIPAFNPLNMFSDVQADPMPAGGAEPVFSDSVYGAKVEGEVSISLTSFPSNSELIDASATPEEPVVERRVRQAARFLAANSIETAARTLVDPARYDFNLARQPEFARLAVRITPENVSFVSKQDDETHHLGMDEKIVPIAEESDMFDVLRDNDVSEEESEQIRTAFQKTAGVTLLEPGQRLRIAFQPAPEDATRMRPERVSLYEDTDHQATVARTDTGTYVQAKAPANFLADAFAEADRVSYGGQTPALYDSIYQTALEQDISKPVIEELIRVFSFDVDFNSRVQPGDSLEVLYADDAGPASGEVLYAALNTGSSKRRFYRFRTSDDGAVDYYDANGQSAKKFLMRKPLSGGRFRSGFGMRRHPIHKYAKMHTGVDWAASRGTPVMAAGNGTVIKAGWSSSYGQRIEVRHANGYTTTYNHLSGFAKGLEAGQSIHQGQIIGYVGSTGLSTGPHLHYEVMVNDRYVDPMRIRLPRGRVLDGQMLANFEAERLRIDNLLDKARRPARVASAQ
ncbi:M23 family metallopeptidase [Roseibium suaedae]|uniref:Murein DD-endopeptidase MepM and murein hydrolase activator NlpD, contain LysM domain n=1 Tax=Roseibium suaedae TaxID=735517 RepID=A0A1M7NBA7_9HYPH|nr:M23 family metallopeptidase [Roseibium suaedae]SHN00950.1 Murein DD-endopeptidase MepM and murein hydrolase activator NlpD, contain LysM domain [Roseibium suaedae]